MPILSVSRRHTTTLGALRGDVGYLERPPRAASVSCSRMHVHIVLCSRGMPRTAPGALGRGSIHSPAAVLARERARAARATLHALLKTLRQASLTHCLKVSTGPVIQ